MAYIFDTNIFIRSKNEMPIDLWPTFWTRVAEMMRLPTLFAVVVLRFPMLVMSWVYAVAA